MSLEKVYFDIKTKFEDFLEIEPFSIVKSVNDHRNFWKPNKVKILLLAESHVYTSNTEYDNTMQYDRFPELIACPVNYVKLVYCLGYGEKYLVRLDGNTGTPQFWKIFASCINRDFYSESEKILLSKTPNFYQRLNNKISLLEKLKENGVWLVDASIVALYNDNIKPSPKIIKEIIEISWEQHVSKVIHEIKPEKIIVIGKGVSKILEDELNKINIPFHVQSQPQGIRSKKGQEEAFEKYYEICNS